jgi:hypothetical protein
MQENGLGRNYQAEMLIPSRLFQETIKQVYGNKVISFEFLNLKK